MNHYDTLGVASTATAKEIKAAWRRLSSKHHPDREGGDDAAMQAINAAYDTLSDPAKRALYDKLGFDADAQRLDAAAVTLLTDTFAHVVESPGDVDLVVLARSLLSQGRNAKKVAADRIYAIVLGLERKAGRVKLRDSAKPGARDLYAELLADRIARLRDEAQQGELQLAIIDRALELLADYEGAGPAVVPSGRVRFNPYQNTTGDVWGGRWGL